MSDYSNVSLDKHLAEKIDIIVKKEPRYKSRSWLVHHILNKWIDDEEQKQKWG